MANDREFLMRSFGGVLLGFVMLASASVLGPIAMESAFPRDQLLEPGKN